MYVTTVVRWIDTSDYSIYLDCFGPFLIIGLAPLSSTVKVKVLPFPIYISIHAVCKYAPSVYLLHPLHMNMFSMWLLWSLASSASNNGFFLRVSNQLVTVQRPCIIRSPHLDNVAVFAQSQLPTSLCFSLFAQPVKSSWLIKTTFCVTHTAGFIWEMPNIRDPLETLHIATPAVVVAGTKVFFILLSPPPMGSPDGPRSQTGNLAVIPRRALQTTAALCVHW